MGYLLKEALKTLCGVNQWAYAVFWKIGCQNPKLLIWEESYHEPVLYSGLPRISGLESSGKAFEGWDARWSSGVQAKDKVGSLVNKMMINSQVHVVGEGLVGRVAFTGNYQWIMSENYTVEAHPPEVLNEMLQQFSAGMQTVVVVPVLPHGVVQFGSSLAIMENFQFVHDVKTLVLQLGGVPGAFSSENSTTKESGRKMEGPVCPGASVSMDSSENYNMLNSSTFVTERCYQEANLTQPSGPHSLITQIQENLQCTSSTLHIPVTQSLVETRDDCFEQKVFSGLPVRNQLEYGVTRAETIHANQEALLNKGASLSIPRFGFDQLPFVAPTAANYNGLKAKEQEIMPNGVGKNLLNDSSTPATAFVMSQMKTNGGLNSTSQKDLVTTPLLGGNKPYNGVGSHMRLISNVSSLPVAQRLANINVPCSQPARCGLQSMDSSRTEVSTSELVESLSANQLVPGSNNSSNHAIGVKNTQIELTEMELDNDLFRALNIPMGHPGECMPLSEHNLSFQTNQKHEYGNKSPKVETDKFEAAYIQPSSGDDLFDVLGVDFKNKLFNSRSSNAAGNGQDTDYWGNIDSTPMKLENAGWDVYSTNEGNSESGVFSVNGSDHLLDAVVSRVHSAVKQSSDDDLSCRTTLTKISGSSAPNASPSYGRVSMSDQIIGELYGLPKSFTKTGSAGSCLFSSGSFKEDAGSYSQSSSVYGSQISSWVEQGHSRNSSASISTAYSKKPDETSKSNRKRLKPGENPRPRPKDRQMIQDRVKELREIVPNGAKCSIDALLERTIKHMLFLQSITKHADKLKQTRESKIISNEGGLPLKDNFKGGATWAYEVGLQSVACPIIVEDLNAPRQMLVEMLCEERGLFLEIADIIRGLGLTILKGVMETRSDKIWARFAVEANRDVTRMEIFLSLARLLEQTVKSSSLSANVIENDNMLVHQTFHQPAPITATGRPL